MQDKEKEATQRPNFVSFSDSQRPSTSSRHRPNTTPQIELLKQRCDHVKWTHPDAIEVERLRKEIETLEREANRHDHNDHNEGGEKLKKVIQEMVQRSSRAQKYEPIFREIGYSKVEEITNMPPRRVSLSSPIYYSLESLPRQEISPSWAQMRSISYDSLFNFSRVGEYGVV